MRANEPNHPTENPEDPGEILMGGTDSNEPDVTIYGNAFGAPEGSEALDRALGSGSNIKVKPSLIPPDLAGRCTVCLREDSGIWRKEYDSGYESRNECELLGLMDANGNLTFEATVDPEDLTIRGYWKQPG